MELRKRDASSLLLPKKSRISDSAFTSTACSVYRAAVIGTRQHQYHPWLPWFYRRCSSSVSTKAPVPPCCSACSTTPRRREAGKRLCAHASSHFKRERCAPHVLHSPQTLCRPTLYRVVSSFLSEKMPGVDYVSANKPRKVRPYPR